MKSNVTKGPINFIRHSWPARHFYREIGFRPPKKGEWYLSGAIVEAYLAPSDMTVAYTIVEMGARAIRRTVEVPAGL